jgi:hypothetical protein
VLRERIRSWLLAGGRAVVDVPPMVGRDVNWIDPAGFDGVDRPQNVVDLGPAIDAQKNLATGTYERQGRIGSPGVTARAMSILETIVPKSLAAQRTKAKTAPGAKLTTRRRRSTIVSSAMQPKRIQCSIRFSSQVSSTRVRSFVLFSVRQSAGELALITRLHNVRGIRARAARAACRRRSVHAERRRP